MNFNWQCVLVVSVNGIKNALEKYFQDGNRVYSLIFNLCWSFLFQLEETTCLPKIVCWSNSAIGVSYKWRLGINNCRSDSFFVFQVARMGLPAIQSLGWSVDDAPVSDTGGNGRERHGQIFHSLCGREFLYTHLVYLHLWIHPQADKYIPRVSDPQVCLSSFHSKYSCLHQAQHSEPGQFPENLTFVSHTNPLWSFALQVIIKPRIFRMGMTMNLFLLYTVWISLYVQCTSIKVWMEVAVVELGHDFIGRVPRYPDTSCKHNHIWQ